MYRALFLVGILTGVLCAQPAPPPQGPMSTTLKVGDMAPDFELPSTDGKPVKLSDFRGKKTVVLAFFPAAFTGGCTKEMQTYQLGFSRFEGTGAQIFGVSTDNSPSQREFAKSLNLTFPLLSDFLDRKVATSYGVLNTQRGIANRVTFVIDKEGRISYMEQGTTAIDTTGAGEACSRLAHRTS
jgi:thioredoxin-dependent peroxiredoxin